MAEMQTFFIDSDSPLANSKGLSMKCPRENVSSCYSIGQADPEGGCSRRIHIRLKTSLILHQTEGWWSASWAGWGSPRCMSGPGPSTGLLRWEFCEACLPGLSQCQGDMANPIPHPLGRTSQNLPGFREQ